MSMSFRQSRNNLCFTMKATELKLFILMVWEEKHHRVLSYPDYVSVVMKMVLTKGFGNGIRSTF